MKFTPKQLDEIRKSYLEAKYRSRQIGILADLYLCRKDDIRDAIGDALDAKDIKKKAEKTKLHKYDPEVKRRAIAAVVDGGERVSVVAKRNNMSPKSLATWATAARAAKREGWL